MLPRRILNSLTRNEIIALCVYFDIDFDVYDEEGNNLGPANKYVLVQSLLRMDTNKIIYKYVNFKRVHLYANSQVLFGQFTRSNIYCRRIMRRIGLNMNSSTFATVHMAWSQGVKFTYAQLPDMVMVAQRRFNRCVSRSLASSSLIDFVESL